MTSGVGVQSSKQIKGKIPALRYLWTESFTGQMYSNCSKRIGISYQEFRLSQHVHGWIILIKHSLNYKLTKGVFHVRRVSLDPFVVLPRHPHVLITLLFRNVKPMCLGWERYPLWLIEPPPPTFPFKGSRVPAEALKAITGHLQWTTAVWRGAEKWRVYDKQRGHDAARSYVTIQQGFIENLLCVLILDTHLKKRCRSSCGN